MAVSGVVRALLEPAALPLDARWGIAWFIGFLCMYGSPNVRKNNCFRRWVWVSFCMGALAAGLAYFLTIVFPRAASSPAIPFL
jgi:hypothetical protein